MNYAEKPPQSSLNRSYKSETKSTYEEPGFDTWVSVYPVGRLFRLIRENCGAVIGVFALGAIACHLLLRYAFPSLGKLFGFAAPEIPLLAALLLGGLPLLVALVRDLFRLKFSSDLLAGIAIVTAVLSNEYLAGTLVVLMLSGGQALESHAIRSASSALDALAKRMPRQAHQKSDVGIVDIPVDTVSIGDSLLIFPHEYCPVDGTVVDGNGTMDESYLTGEPYVISKIPGSVVMSGAINGETALVIRAEKKAVDSRYAKIMEVMRESEQRKPRIRRLGDQLGAVFTPLAVSIAMAAWLFSGEAIRFLAVLVVATPCPLLIAIPVTVISSISLAARRGIIVKDPAVLEIINTCKTAMFDKTGTLTYGQPKLVKILPASGFSERDILTLTASLERYSRHPLASAILESAVQAGLPLLQVTEVSERPGQGLRGIVGGRNVCVTNRKKFMAQHAELGDQLPVAGPGMESIVVVDDTYAGLCQFRDEPRLDARAFISHLAPLHGINKVLLVSGDRESEVRYLAQKVGITTVHACQSPEEKLNLVRVETRRANTIFLGDGVNDAPALSAATVGIALGTNCDVASEAAGVVMLSSSLQQVDELLHIGRRMRSIALQSAIGGIAFSVVGMVLAATGYLPPVAGALFQELIDVVVIANALRATAAPHILSDY